MQVEVAGCEEKEREASVLGLCEGTYVDACVQALYADVFCF